ncbi:MAG: hypothetical protein IJT60_03385 [Clostridia bacterium]|nr:hypothetical protein [Clostridia bacterium]MBQ7727604.1 hypothetical protein [Clostridia bacterium]
MKILTPNSNGTISLVEVNFENTAAFSVLLADVNGMIDSLPIRDTTRAELSARLAGLLAEARRSAFAQGADAMADLLGVPIQTEAEPIRPHV